MERYILARLLLGGFLLFLMIFLIIRIASGGGGSETTEFGDPSVLPETTLTDLTANPSSSVQFIKDGKINAKEDHQQIRFTISSDERRVEFISGYNGKVEESVTLLNTAYAYEHFLHALEAEGYSSAKEDPKQTDSRGVCSSGTRYFYRTQTGSYVQSEYWSTSCRNADGTSAADRKDIVRLFERQFPEYNAIEREAGYSGSL